MSYLDKIVLYLSGDLSKDDASSLKQEMESNEELKQEYERVSAAFGLIKDQLQKRGEAEFRNELLKVMEADSARGKKAFLGRRLPWLLPLAAACFAVALVIFLSGGNSSEKLLAKYFDPDGDPIIAGYMQESRGENEMGIYYYRTGHYHEAFKAMMEQANQESANTLDLLYLLLASMEIDREEEIIDLVISGMTENAWLPDQALRWYSSLALLKLEREEESLLLLSKLSLESGPYQTSAEKLEKNLLK